MIFFFPFQVLASCVLCQPEIFQQNRGDAAPLRAFQMAASLPVSRRELWKPGVSQSFPQCGPGSSCFLFVLGAETGLVALKRPWTRHGVVVHTSHPSIWEAEAEGQPRHRVEIFVPTEKTEDKKPPGLKSQGRRVSFSPIANDHLRRALQMPSQRTAI